jgi:uncharacterized protein (UPF0179 family)
MITITLVSETAAKPGYSFYYIGEMDACAECKLRKVCLNLEKGSLYQVKEVREMRHTCPETEETVRVAEAEKIPFPAAMAKKSAIEGTVVTFKETDCGRVDCGNWFACHPPAGIDGGKYTVTEIGEDAECRIGENIVLVKLI